MSASHPEPKAQDILDLPDVPNRLLSRNKRMGRDISYGIQQTIACWATDFIDPPLSMWLQNRWGNKAADHRVTAKHVIGGEVLGDTAAFFIYMFVKRAFTRPLDALIGGVKKTFDRRLTKMGEHALEPWQRANHLEKNDPRYRHKLEVFKEFQAENWVDSTIVATAATAANVPFQKMTGNKQSWKLILASKVVGAAATLALMLGLRTGYPSGTSTLDEELSGRYFSHVVRGTKKLFGVKEDEAEREVRLKAAAERKARNKHLPPPPAVEIAGAATLGSMVAQKLADREQEWSHLVPKSVGLGAITGGAVLGLHYLLRESSKVFNDETDQRYLSKVSRKVKKAFGVREKRHHAAAATPPESYVQKAEDRKTASALEKS